MARRHTLGCSKYTNGTEVLKHDSLTFRKSEQDDLLARTTYDDDWQVVT